jgi:hypothetical protein
VGWQTYGLNDQWNQLITKWAAANGFSYWTSFYSWTNAYLAPVSAAGNCNPPSPLTDYPAAVMANLGATTLTGTSYRIAGLWPATSLQGTATLAGRASLGHY